MNEVNRDIDELLRRNTERQLADFDWDRHRQTVMHRLAVTQARESRRVVAVGAVVGVAAALVLTGVYACMSLLRGTHRDAIPPTETAAVQESVEDDLLLASTDPTTILLTGSMQLLVSNDSTLAPHSLWDQ